MQTNSHLENIIITARLLNDNINKIKKQDSTAYELDFEIAKEKLHTLFLECDVSYGTGTFDQIYTRWLTSNIDNLIKNNDKLILDKYYNNDAKMLILSSDETGLIKEIGECEIEDYINKGYVLIEGGINFYKNLLKPKKKIICKIHKLSSNLDKIASISKIEYR